MRLAFNNFVLDSEQRVLWKENEAVPLSPKVFETLELLVQSGGRIVTKQEFMAKLWPDSFVEDANLTQNIFVLRRILGSAEDGRPYIETFPRRGYRFVGVLRSADVSLATEGSQPVEEAPAEKVFAAPTSPIPAGSAPPLIEANPAPPSPIRRRFARPVWALTAAALILLWAVGAGFALRWKSRMRVESYRRITNDGKSKDVLSTPAIIVVGGNTLYFNEPNGERNVFAQVPEEGGEVIYDATLPVNVHLVGLRHGPRDALLLGSNWPVKPSEPLLSKDLASGVVSQVFDLHAQDGSWAPDGKKLAYAQLGTLFVRSADGATVSIATVGGLAYWPRWSPDGRVLRFSESYQGFHSRLWQVDSDGGNLHQLFADESDSDHMCCGSWTDSGRAFVYLSIQTNNSKIHVRSEDPAGWSGLAQQSMDISASPLDRWTAPVPSPDGKQIFAIGEQLHGQLVRIDAATRRPQPFIGGISAEGVSFSPDGQNIVWTAYPEGTLWRSRSDGSGRVQLTQAPLVARFPHWSPDGSTIVFTAARPGSDWQAYIMPANGGEYKLLMTESRGQGVATWSPDGKALAFGHLLNVVEAQKQPLDIEIFRPGARTATILPGSTGLWTARWSPDGRYLSAVTADNQTLRLYDMQTSTWSDLAHSNINDVVWSPDSKSLFFDTNPGSDPALYRVRLSNRKLEAWASLKDFRRAGFFGPWLGMAQDGSPILLEDTSIQELYSIAVHLP